MKRGKEPSIAEHAAERPASAAPSTLPPASGVQRGKKPYKSDGWVVVSEFERDGHEYRVLRRPLDTVDPPSLTLREEQALELAASGYSNKRIAQRLEISPSTVGVLLFRAAAKLGVKSRGELIAAFCKRRGME